MSFLGMGRPQPTSEQKIAAVEGEMRMMADTYNRYAPPLLTYIFPSLFPPSGSLLLHYP